MSRSSQPRKLLSGMYAGPVSRLLAFVLDSTFVTVGFTLVTAGIAYLVGLFTSVEVDAGRAKGLWWTLGIVVWAFVYSVTSLVVAGRTAGKTVTGLRVVERDGSPLRPRAAFVRTLTMPLTFCTLGIGFVGLAIGRERRALHDVFAGTTVVYDWGDRPAELPAPLTQYLTRREAVPAGPDSPPAP